MDFETRHTPEQEREREAFRVEFRAWLRDNAGGVAAPPDPADLTREQFEGNRAFLRRLGARGWFAPTWPVEYGGAGLGPHVARVVREELEKALPHLENVHPPGDISGAAASAVRALGSEELRRTLLPRLVRGEAIVWELYTEPDAGSDLPSLKSTARRDGDAYVVNGTKTFAGGHFEADYYFVLAISNPERPRRENLSAFLVPPDLPGITMTDLDMMAGSLKRTIMFEDVRVPATQRIGEEGQGWMVFNTSLHGALTVGVGPGLDRAYDVFERLLEYCREHGLGAEPHVQEALTRAYVDLQVQRLFLLRADWLAASGQRVTYEGTQVALGRKLTDLRLGDAIHAALGPLSMIKDRAWAPFEGDLEYFHRYAILMAHPGGTVEIQKLRMFRGMTGGVE
jgi:alkylation response protein AidB-like acyl-CoA dehydrogenase